MSETSSNYDFGQSRFDPIDLMNLRDRVRQRAGTWTDQKGRLFNLRYEGDTTVFYQAVDIGVPCGYLNVAKLLREV